MAQGWKLSDIPDQTGRTAVVTGANSGIGYHAALELARRGATVVMACRSTAKGDRAAADIRQEAPSASVEVRTLDLGSLESVKSFADEVSGAHDQIDLLVNNAGIMMVPQGSTEDGLELQIGTNHFGHFALTGRLLPLLQATSGSRVVSVSSIAHRGAKLYVNDMFFEQHDYNPQTSYGQSKLANLLFHFELQRRLQASDAGDTVSLACHPGVAPTNLSNHLLPKFLQPIAKPVMGLLLNSVPDGALPTLRAATDPTLQGGEYLGPHAFNGVRGRPVVQQPDDNAHNTDWQTALWNRSVDLTGVDPSI